MEEFPIRPADADADNNLMNTLQLPIPPNSPGAPVNNPAEVIEIDEAEPNQEPIPATLPLPPPVAQEELNNQFPPANTPTEELPLPLPDLPAQPPSPQQEQTPPRSRLCSPPPELDPKTPALYEPATAAEENFWQR